MKELHLITGLVNCPSRSRKLMIKHCNPVQGQYRARTGFSLCSVGKNLISLKGTPVLIAGTLYSLQGIPCENYYTGKSL